MDMKRYQNMSKRYKLYATDDGSLQYQTIVLLASANTISQNVFGKPYATPDFTSEQIGNVLWSIAQICTSMGLSLDLIATANLARLAKLARNNESNEP